MFLVHTENELQRLFSRIDSDHQGRISKESLTTAFRSARMEVSPDQINRFFTDMDRNRNGVITFDEWR